MRLPGKVGFDTFGFDRHINQTFYRSKEWHDVRDYVLARDFVCDLGVGDYPITDRPLVHHMNPMAPEDIIRAKSWILDPEYLITVSHKTHNAIHYGDERQLPQTWVPRAPGDTKLW